MRAFVVVLCVLLTGTLAATPALLGESRLSQDLAPVLSALEVEAKADAALPVCLFVHGLGQSPSKDVLLPEFPLKDYWGSTLKAVLGNHCTPMYVHYNSQSRAWTDKGLQTTVCNLISQSKARIVFSHSMGNNVIGAAIANNIPGCDFVPYQASKPIPAGKRAWVSLQGVFGGSTASDFCVRVCKNDFTVHDILAKLATTKPSLTELKAKLKTILTPEFVDKITDLQTFRDFAAKVVSLVPKARTACVCKNGRAGPAIESCSYAQTKVEDWKKLTATAREYAFRATCGLGPWPVALKFVQSLFMPIPYFLLEAFQGYGKDFITQTRPPMTGTDGFVTWTSCRAERPDSVWEPIPKARYYVGRMNHADGTGRTGDGKDPDQKPVTFILESVLAIKPLLQN